MTVAERIDAELGDELARIRAAPEQLNVANRPEAYVKIRELADQAAKLVAPYVPCRKGCSHCCHIAVGMSGHEAAIIGRYTGRQPARVPDLQAGIAERVRVRFTGVACTFLKDGECSIYAVRPMACRVHFSAEENAEPCELKEVQRVAYVNLRPLEWAAAGMFLKSGYADIREFFPPEAE